MSDDTTRSRARQQLHAAQVLAERAATRGSGQWPASAFDHACTAAAVRMRTRRPLGSPSALKGRGGLP
jgi:hypothetical protein